MTMRSISMFWPGVLALALCVGACSSARHGHSKRLPGMWQAQPAVIDGSNTDWPSPYPFYDEDAMLGYAVSNDTDNLYITVETGDPATQLKLLREGFTVWIDKTGKEEEMTAINFPIPRSASEGGAALRPEHSLTNLSPQQQRFEIEDKVKGALLKATEYSLQGFKACNLQYPIGVKDSCGIYVRMAVDVDNELVWEAVIPFRSFYFKPRLTRADKGKPISICFETTGQKRPAGQPSGNGSGRAGRGGVRPGIGLGVGGMGLGMNMGGGGRQSAPPTMVDLMEPLYKSTKTWKKVGLAFGR